MTHDIHPGGRLEAPVCERELTPRHVRAFVCSRVARRMMSSLLAESLGRWRYASRQEALVLNPTYQTVRICIPLHNEPPAAALAPAGGSTGWRSPEHLLRESEEAQRQVLQEIKALAAGLLNLPAPADSLRVACLHIQEDRAEALVFLSDRPADQPDEESGAGAWQSADESDAQTLPAARLAQRLVDMLPEHGREASKALSWRASPQAQSPCRRALPAFLC